MNKLILAKSWFWLYIDDCNESVISAKFFFLFGEEISKFRANDSENLFFSINFFVSLV